jgi:hypothetical protein
MSERITTSRGGRGGDRGGTSRGRGGRPNRPGRNSTSNTIISRTPNKKNPQDYQYFLGSAKQASDYETTTSYLINHIKKTYNYGNDIATALEQLQEADFSQYKPNLKSSQSDDKTIKELETEQFKMEFKTLFDVYIRRENTYQMNLSKAYAFLWEHCTKAMQNKIESRQDFDKYIVNNPIKLLEAIKEHALHFQDKKYPMTIIMDAFRAFSNTKQKENESLQDYTKRFKVAKEVLESHLGGPINLTKYITTMKEFTSENELNYKNLSNMAFEQYCAYLYLEQSDKKKYGSIMNGLSTQYSLNNNQYPKSLTEAVNVLSNHKFDANYFNRSSRNNDQEDQVQPHLSFAQLEGRCYCCGVAGHLSPDCPHKSRPKSKWYMRTGQIFIQSSSQPTSQSSGTVSTMTSETNTTTTLENNNPTTPPRGWQGYHAQLANLSNILDMKNLILLDNQSTDHVFCNPTLVTNIRRATQPLALSTNGGIFHSNFIADTKHAGEVYYNEEGLTNILSMSLIEELHTVTYDHIKKIFWLHVSPTQSFPFHKTLGLYIYNPFLKEEDNNYQFVNAVEENKLFYTSRQFERAKRARELYNTLGTPSLKDFKTIIQMNFIKDNPVTIEDVNIAENIFGQDIGSLKGKTTRKKPLPVVSDYIEIPRALMEAQRDVVLCMDTMNINGLSFLTTISRNLMYRTTEWVPNKTSNSYRSALDNVF